MTVLCVYYYRANFAFENWKVHVCVAFLDSHLHSTLHNWKGVRLKYSLVGCAYQYQTRYAFIISLAATGLGSASLCASSEVGA
jgi:hypothetical protein